MHWVKWLLGGLLVAALCALRPLPAQADAVLTVYIDGEAVMMNREVYLTGVVAAEMPAAYEPEALKAQAVAARTRVIGTTCLSHPEADVCAQSACCQGYLDEEGQAERWGKDTAYYQERIRSAVQATNGVIMTYEGEPIEVLYHAVSGGYTEDVEAVYQQALPYLRGVPSPGEEDASGYETVQIFSQAELVAAFPDAKKNNAVRLTVVERSASGRVLKLMVGPFAMSGRVFRSALGLRSTNFVIEQAGDSVVIRQVGYGHGVGMSQAGANAMAQAGATYEEILRHYYTGVELALAD